MNAQLTFQELRDKCYRHFLYLPYVNHRQFSNPDRDWLKDEFNSIMYNIQGISYSHGDLINAFYSSVFELEFKKVFLPNSLIYKFGIDSNKPQLSRLIRFTSRYGEIIVRHYSYSSPGKLCTKEWNHHLKYYRLALLVDPLSK